MAESGKNLDKNCGSLTIRPVVFLDRGVGFMQKVLLKFEQAEALRKRQAKPKEIAGAAAKLFQKTGYLETNMNDVAAASGVSKGGIYHYFRSKDEVLYFILDSYMDVIIGDLELDLAKLKTPSEKLRYIISRHLDLYVKNQAEAKTLLHDAYCLPPNLHRTIVAKERKYYTILAETISAYCGDRSGSIKPEVRALTFLLLGMCNWVYSWYDPKGSISPEGLSEIVWTVFLKGVNEYRCNGGHGHRS